MIRRLLGASLLGLSLGGLVYISDEWKEAILAEHNRERAVYHEPPYIWSDAIAQQAARKADSCVGSHSSWASREYASEACNSPTCKHNENLAYM
ncbi:MAG: uncharacterized protein KVP18_004719 [Porospora cf. gigantea A]|nr:MAG: hypothetical protein KVP18_004719 [Porospora cf. gigantea A]